MEETGNSWESWFQGVAGTVVDKWSSATYQHPYEIQKLRLQALGSEGYYSEGQSGATNQNSNGLGISPGMLILIGAAMLAVVMLKD